MNDMPLVQDLSQRLMHRFPGDTETQKNWKWMRFLPPAHLCPQCCTKQKWRKKVILARNPFVRLASMFQFAWLPSTEHPSERKAKLQEEAAQRARGGAAGEEGGSTTVAGTTGAGEDAGAVEINAATETLPLSLPAKRDEPTPGTTNVAGVQIPVDTITSGRSGPYEDWNDFAPWLRHVLALRAESPKKFAGDYHRFGDREKVIYCRNETLTEDMRRLKAAGSTLAVDPAIADKDVGRVCC